MIGIGSSQFEAAIETLTEQHHRQLLVRIKRDRSAEVLGLRSGTLNRFHVQPDGEVTLIESREISGRGRWIVQLIAFITGLALFVTGMIYAWVTDAGDDGPWWLYTAIIGGFICCIVAGISYPKLEHFIPPGEQGWTQRGSGWDDGVEA